MVLREKVNRSFVCLFLNFFKKIQFLLLLALMQSEHRVTEPDVRPLHKTLPVLGVRLDKTVLTPVSPST